VNAFVIGEHGDASVPVWSAANVVGVPLDEYAKSVGIQTFKDEYSSIHQQVSPLCSNKLVDCFCELTMGFVVVVVVVVVVV
jgi:hypothetical protein